MALTSPGVEVTIIDQSQYLPAPGGSVPLVVLATAQNKADASGTGVAAATTAANAGKLYQITSQRDLVNLYGTPFFYTTTNGTPIQGYELNEYGLLAAYSTLGVTNRCYVLRADIDLASLVGQTGRPTGAPADGTYWLDTTNTTWGINVFNATTGKFTNVTPIVITDPANLSAGVPLSSIGNIGDYAVNAIQQTGAPSSTIQFFYKTVGNLWVLAGGRAWKRGIPTVQGTTSNPTLSSGTFSVALNGSPARSIVFSGTTVADVATAINNLNWRGLRAEVRNGKLCVFGCQSSYPTIPQSITLADVSGSVFATSGITPGQYYQPELVFGTAAQMPLWTSSQTYPRPTGSVWIKIGEAGNGLTPVVAKYNATTAAWVNKSVSQAITDWDATASLDATGGKAIPAGTIYSQYQFDPSYTVNPTYMWERIATGPTVVTGTTSSFTYAPATTNAGSFVGSTNAALDPTGLTYTIKSIGTTDFTAIGASSNTVGLTFIATGAGSGTGVAYNGSSPFTFTVQTSIPNSTSLSIPYIVTVPLGSTATDFVSAWITQDILYTTATVTTDGAIQLTHTEGGEIILNDFTKGISNGLLAQAGFVIGTTAGCKYGLSTQFTFNGIHQRSTSGVGAGATFNVQAGYQTYFDDDISVATGGSGYVVGDTVTVSGTSLGGTTPTNDVIFSVVAVSGSNAITSVTKNMNTGYPQSEYTTQLSNWREFTYVSNEGQPAAAPANNTNWFYSVADQVDIMVQKGGNWIGYGMTAYDSTGAPSATGSNMTDPNGPIISASAPMLQSDGTTALAYGDLWIDTSDLENYPIISRWESVSSVDQWVLIDNTNQVGSTGVVFADARWANSGSVSPVDDPIVSIPTLLTSDYLDLDAPAATLYPQGMLLFNTRRSGYNVKQFRVNYFNATTFPDAVLPVQTDSWVTVSGNQSNGSPYMGRKAQRAVVVKALNAVIATNTAIRDEDNFFNLIVTPNYPELQPGMVVLNADRGETAYILGDTPMRLPDDATAIQAWATNAAGATSTGEDGCVTRNTYMGLFYPSGITNDLAGNLVAVPPSHMMLRTFIRNDNIAYPWLAAAGTRRGNIDNATNIGYLDAATGEFQTIKTRLGIRDVLYTNFINPSVFFTGVGLLNYGNKTSFNSSSALDRTNVARLVAYIRRQLTLAARPFVFEPNDSLTRQQIAGVVQTLMIDLVAKRGLYDYLVVCDDSNNTPARIDRNELWIDVAVEPVKAAEFIYIPVRILNTGELSATR